MGQYRINRLGICAALSILIFSLVTGCTPSLYSASYHLRGVAANIADIIRYLN
ncbi:MAG: hypothetical protein KDA54_00105 [Phycisphaerales bacterium]|nr:hypothetical protein [Phycisphaerales bacterium]